MREYYNTTNLEGTELEDSIAKATTQQEEIANTFAAKHILTASEAWQVYGTLRCPLTSIRRAITNLTEIGYLFKTENTKIGIYGKPEYYYAILSGQLNLFKN
jgi:hypothetical protein